MKVNVSGLRISMLFFLQSLLLCSPASSNIKNWTGSINGSLTFYSSLICQRDTTPVADTFDFYVSNQGLNSNSGTSVSTPKLSIASVNALVNDYAAINKYASVGLKTGSSFREQFDILKDNISISNFGVQDGRKAAQITGMDIVKDWQKTPLRTNVYECTVTHTIDLINPYYHYVFVAEIDTALEKLFPVSAVRYLPLVSTLEQCDATPGSFFIVPLTQNPVTINIHPSAGIPGKNKYRYEVVTRPFTINSFYYNNCTFENLFLQSSGNGYGMLGAGNNTVVKNVTFQGGGVHHAVIRSGNISHTVFLPGPKSLNDEVAFVFYAPEGQGNINRISNTVFFDVNCPLLTHTNGTSNYRSLLVDSVYAFADTLNASRVFGTDNTDSVIISNSYSNGYKNFWIGTPPYIAVKNSVINNSSEPAIFLASGYNTPCTAEVSNTLITTNSNNINQPALTPYQIAAGFLFVQDRTSLKVSNTVFYAKSTWQKQYETVFAFVHTLVNKLEAKNNIYICDVSPESDLLMDNANNSSGLGTASNIVSDYNVYILLKGSFYWRAYPNSPQGDASIFSLKDWQSFTGQDQHSIFIDLRNNPAGLKAVFTDPENGNWTLAQTPQADSVRKLNAGMFTPPLFYPLRTVYEDALDYTLPGGLSIFTGSRDMNHEITLNWKTIKEPNLAYFGIESGIDKSNFTPVANVHAKQRYLDNQYSFSHSDTSSSGRYFRLRLMNKDSSYSFSSTVFIDPIKKASIINEADISPMVIIIYPNPVQTGLTVEHPVRDKGEISVFDYSGRKLKSVAVQGRSSLTYVSVTNLPAGKYVIEWSSGQEKKAVSFVKGK